MPRNILSSTNESRLVGVIASIEQNDEKDYTKVVIANAIPWKTVYPKFYVWKKEKLYYGDDNTPYKAGDLIYLEYKPAKFNRLISISLLDPFKYSDCPTCYALYELPQNAQRIDCGDCSPFDTEKRTRAPDELTLIASSNKQCQYSPAQILTFADEANTAYFCWIFEGQPLYAEAGELKVKQDYNISGWIAKQSQQNKAGNFNLTLTKTPKVIAFE